MDVINKFSIKVAAKIVVTMLLCISIFHILVLVGLIPYSIVWGGRLESAFQMHVFESVALTINLIIISIVGMKVGYIRPLLSGKVINIILWFLVAFFLLNTVGNIMSLSTVEAIVFTPLTLISALLFYRMAVEQ